jgi:hypothetical protein
VSRDQHDGSLWPYSRISRPEPLLFLSSSSSIVLTRLSGFTISSQLFCEFLLIRNVFLRNRALSEPDSCINNFSSPLISKVVLYFSTH